MPFLVPTFVNFDQLFTLLTRFLFAPEVADQDPASGSLYADEKYIYLSAANGSLYADKCGVLFCYDLPFTVTRR